MAENNENYMDFDEFFEEMEAEQKGKQLSFKFKGKTYYLPASMPAILPVKLMELKEKYGKEEDIPSIETYALLLKLIGKEDLEEIATKATSEQLNLILRWISQQYNSRTQKNNGDKEKGPGKK